MARCLQTSATCERAGVLRERTGQDRETSHDRKTMTRLVIRSTPFLALLVLSAPQPVSAQAATGLPPNIDWSFNFDAGWGSFGFANSLFDNPKDPVPENLSDQWFEGYVKPALSGTYRLQSSSEIYGKLSVVGERTYGSAPELYGTDVSSFGPEDALIGWRSGKSIGSSDNLIDVTVGRAQYRIGHGFLLWDGASEGGSRGGYWTNARKAFEFAAIGRVKPGPHLGEFFYLDKDELEESDSGTRVLGGNYEFTHGESTTVGATYMKLFAHQDVRPGRDGLNVFNVREELHVGGAERGVLAVCELVIATEHASAAVAFVELVLVEI